MKNIKKIFNYKKGIWVLSVLFLLTSCEDFLQDELLSDVSVDFLYNSPEGLETAVVGLYALNRKHYRGDFWNLGSIPLILQAKSDLALGRAGHAALFAWLDWGSTLSDHGSASFMARYWKLHYKIIDRCNAVIKGAEGIEGIDEAQRNQILAEAKCMRAEAYFNLYRQYNNIFVTTEPTTPENAFDKPADKSSEEEIFNLLKSDLDFAIANLEMTTEEFGRWTQASARHLRAKVAVWQKDWAEAASQTDAIITDENYSLVPETKDVFKGDLKNTETLFAYQYERDAIGGGEDARSFANWNVIPNYALVPGTVKSDQNGGSGAGFLMLNNYIRNLLKEDPNDDRDDATYYISNYFFNSTDGLPAGKQVGDTIDIYDQYGTASDTKNYYTRINPGILKFRDETAEPTSLFHQKNIMIYRLAETYLIGAEAHMMNGNTEKALEYINAVRNRAKAASIDVIDQKAILDERARELAFEGQRWYTLKRMGVLLEYLKDHMGNDNWNQTRKNGDPRTRIEEHMKNWPIPESQIELLGPNYPQNDGY